MKVIQVGVGGFGAHWLRLLNDYPGIKLAALVDIDSETLEKASQFAGVTTGACFADLETAVDQVQADALICVSPPVYHRQHTITAMKAGLDVICEKPLAINMADAVAMAQYAKDNKRLFAVSQNYRYRPVTWTMHKLIANGEIGELGQINLDFYKGWFFTTKDFRRTMDHPLLSDMGIHHFDLLRYITGSEALTVRGESWNPPWSKNEGDTSVSLTFTLENNGRFIYSASWCAQGDFADWNGNWLLEGELGSIRYRDGALSLNQTNDQYQVQESRDVPLEGPPVQNQSYVLADFMAARDENRQPLTSIFDNLGSLAMVDAAREAVNSGERVQIAAVDELLA